VSGSSDGTQANGPSGDSSISADGRYVAFMSYASNLVSGDTNDKPDVFVYDRASGTTTLVSVAINGTQSNNSSDYPTISADGRYVAFCSDASNLVIGDTNDWTDAFVHDRQTGQTTRVSVASDGTQADWYVGMRDISISSDGRYVGFNTSADNGRWRYSIVT
jgi:VCBS repeat-containing protein